MADRARNLKGRSACFPKRIVYPVMLIVALGLLIIAFIILEPAFVATRHVYFDVVGGQIKEEYVSFGRRYQIAIRDTEYSKLIKSLEPHSTPAAPVWQETVSSELGIRRMLKTQHVHFKGARLPSTLSHFAFIMDQKSEAGEEITTYVSHVKYLLKNSSPEEVLNFVDSLD